MKAIRIHHFGGSDQLKVEDAPHPKIRENQLLVEVRDAGVNPVDWKVRQNLYHSESESDLPMVMGQDFAGVVLETGKNAAEFTPGDRVFGFADDGAYAEIAVANTDGVTVIPSGIDFVTAAALPTAGLTAWQVVIDTAKIDKGTNVLIQGAAGGVGSFAVQLCKWRGARIIATASRDDFEYLRSIGVDDLIDYNAERFEDRVRDVDVVLDFVGGPVTSRSIAVLKSGGLIVSTTHTVKDDEARARGVRGVNFMMKRDAVELEALARLVVQGIVKPRVSQVLPLEEARQAHDINEKGHSHGKLVLEVAH